MPGGICLCIMLQSHGSSQPTVLGASTRAAAKLIRQQPPFHPHRLPDSLPPALLRCRARAEYAAGSTVFVAKIGKLKESYGSIRRSRGDGEHALRSAGRACLRRARRASGLQAMRQHACRLSLGSQLVGKLDTAVFSASHGLSVGARRRLPKYLAHACKLFCSACSFFSNRPLVCVGPFASIAGNWCKQSVLILSLLMLEICWPFVGARRQLLLPQLLLRLSRAPHIHARTGGARQVWGTARAATAPAAARRWPVGMQQYAPLAVSPFSADL